MTESIPVSQEEQNLYNRLRAGDMSALTTLYHENRTPVHSLVTRNSGSRHDSDDILHEALIILWQQIRTGRFELRARMGTFLYATARNLWLRRLSRRRKEPTADLSALEITDGSVSPLEMMVETEDSDAVRRSLDKLPDPCRSLLIAFYWEELPMKEIAEKFGLANAATAKAKKYQCKEQLKKILQRIS
ncbi:MAG: sigma-70 family RNA polymerase sigma factor [Ignavibacteria bacterium]|nr:sigma-70 family RNA polymerase sigma factor [Ignavibacteria bacterium]